MNFLEKKLYENGVGGEILADDYVKVCTTTTDFLADKLSEHGKKVFVVSNKLCKKDVEISDQILKQVQDDNLQCHSGLDSPRCSFGEAGPESRIKIGYFSGALSHNKDFATITDALMQVMEKHKNAELFLVGPLDIESDLNKFSDRIKQLPYVPREKHLWNVASVDINIAPLEIGNPFCESKSELKFFEAGVVKVPTLAAATDPFKRAIEDGVDGFTANGTEEWFQKLEKLITNEQLRKSMGEKAREKALQKYYTASAKNQEYYTYLRSRISNS